MITIVNYGVGNVRAFLNVYSRLGIPATTASTPIELKDATKIILPGVGAFDNAMALLEQSGLMPTLARMVLEERVPVLGICVGMQMLAHGSEEGSRPGLGWVDGTVRKFSASAEAGARRVPHMGWNDVRMVRPSPLCDGLSAARFYFLHSYYFACNREVDVMGVADYFGEFACVVGAGNIAGVQFHPEKSHHWGSRLLQNFATI